MMLQSTAIATLDKLATSTFTDSVLIATFDSLMNQDREILTSGLSDLSPAQQAEKILRTILLANI